MPELAEVEIIATQLNDSLPGQKLRSVELFKKKWLKKGEFSQLENRKLKGVERWGKRIRFDFSGPIMVVSLGMTGKFYLNQTDEKHLAARFSFTRDQLDYYDVRGFGSCLIFDNPQEAERAMEKLIGLDAGGKYSWQVLRNRLDKGGLNIKAVLLDQARLGGIGNYLADEMLFEARIRPQRSVGDLSDEEWKNLNRARSLVISRARKSSGLSFSDYVDSLGQKGRMSARLKVYGRGGLPCVRCGDKLIKEVVAGRGTVWCRNCQQ